MTGHALDWVITALNAVAIAAALVSRHYSRQAHDANDRTREALRKMREARCER